ncbi:MAG: helix-turn-helix domain-containing protein [Bacillus sp. (in: Bacteria)]|nr:helix-turn-helix domain-containing protein [Bacillus sp. (in: firmicutes)]
MIGKNIYQIRKKRGYTLSELAARAGISKSYLSNIERELNQNPSIQVLGKIAMVLDVDFKTLLGPEAEINTETKQIIESEWLDFVKELKDSGIDKKQIPEYRALIEFIKWQNEKELNK